MQTETKGLVAGATGLAAGALAPGSNLGGEAVKDLSIAETPAANTVVTGIAGGAGNVLGQSIGKDGEVKLPDMTTPEGLGQIGAEALAGGTLAVVAGASGDAIGQTAGKAVGEVAGKFGQGVAGDVGQEVASKFGNAASGIAAGAAVELPTNSINNAVTNGFSPDTPPLDTKPAEATVNAIQDGAQLTPNPNPIPTDTASDAAPPTGGDSGTPLSSAANNAAPPTSGDAGATAPTPVDNAPIAAATPTGGDVGATAPTPVDNTPIAAATPIGGDANAPGVQDLINSSVG